MRKAIRMILLAALLTICLCVTAQAGDDAYTGEFTATFGQTEAREMLAMINDFRTGSQAYYVDYNGNTIYCSNLKELQYSYALEEIAMQRAAEIAIYFAHLRPDGSLCNTVTASNGIRSWGENILWGGASKYGSASVVFRSWREDGESYSGQAHRRNMLDSDYAAVGVGHAYINGIHFWTQEFANYTDDAPFVSACDGDKKVTTRISESRISSISNRTASPGTVSVDEGGKCDVPAAKATGSVSGGIGVSSVTLVTTPSWSSSNTAVARVESGKVIGVKAGTATLTGTAFGGSVTASVTVKKVLPAPGNTAITTVASSGKPKLTWSAVSGAEQYEVYRAGSRDGTYSKMLTTANTSYINTGAEPGRTYYYKVRAVDAKGVAGKFSTVHYITCDCAAPVVKASNSPATGKPMLTWKAVTGASQYEVYRATGKNGTYSKMLTTSGTGYTNVDLDGGTTYYYKVRAICGKSAAGNSAFSGTVTGSWVPAAPTGVQMTTRAASGKPYLTWKAVSGAAKYEIYRSASRSGTYSRMLTTANCSYTNTGAVPGTTYYYKVRAVDSSGKAGVFSEVHYITCDCAAPAITYTGTSSAGKPVLKWSAVEGAKEYVVYRSASRDGTYTKMLTTANCTYTNTSAVSGKTYCYKVMAVCGKSAAGDSAFSGIVSIKCR